MVFQNYALFPHMSVRANVGFGLKMRKVGRAEARRRVDEALRLVQLTEPTTGQAAERVPHAVEDVVDHVAVFLEERLAGRRDVVDFLPLALLGTHVPHVLQELERRIDGAGGGRVPAPHPLLEGLHDLVAVAGLLLQQAEDDVLHLASLEHLMSPSPVAVAPVGALGSPVGPDPRSESGPKELMERPVLVSHRQPPR